MQRITNVTKIKGEKFLLHSLLALWFWLPASILYPYYLLSFYLYVILFVLPL